MHVCTHTYVHVVRGLQVVSVGCRRCFMFDASASVCMCTYTRICSYASVTILCVHVRMYNMYTCIYIHVLS